MNQYYKDARKRIRTQNEKIINLLKERGELGATNTELSKISLNYTSRMSNLYRKGYKFKKYNLDGGLYRYILVSEPANYIYFKNAQDETLEDFDEMFGEEITDAFEKYLEDKHFHIVRKNGWFLQDQFLSQGIVDDSQQNEQF